MNKIDSNLHKFLALGNEKCLVDGIVYYKNRNQLLNFLKDNKIKIVCDLPFISAFMIEPNPHQMFNISRQSFVTYISSVSSVKTLINISKEIIGVKNANHYKGKKQTVAIIDTGTMPHIDFTLCHNRIICFKDFVYGKKNVYDDNGHGTFVTGILAGSGVLSNKKFSGVAPNANIISLKALNVNGEANAVTILEAMQWIFDNHIKYDISVVCMSFGSEPLGSFDPIMKGAEKLWQEGIVVVCAGGNSGPKFETIKSPGISKKIITVGGLNDHRKSDGTYNTNEFEVADFSSRGPALNRIKPDIIAPSVNITSCSYKGGYVKMSGTSVATPMVAGICVLIKQKYPTATPDKIKKYLQSTAITLRLNKYSQGYGVVNAKDL